MLVIVLISKTEAFAMREIVGEKEVKKTYSSHPKYYLVESRKNLTELENYRKNKIVK